MDLATYKEAKDLLWRIDVLEHHIETAKQMRSFCQGRTDVEREDTTAAMKALLLPDLEAQLAQVQKKFADL